MNHACFLAGVLMLFSLNILAQSDGSIAGKVTDTSSGQPVAEATVTVLDTKDSSLVSFARTDQEGRFRIRGLNSGDYRLLITHIGFYNYSSRLRISADLKDFRLDNISLKAKSKMLQEVTVLQEAPPVTIRKDTIEYNAGSFKTKPNAVVEDLLKKLPGLQVDKDGKIKANGEEVKKVLVDGKEFFGNDPKTATKNLPADIVDKVQVFDKKSEQAAFTGFDDGNSEKTINLTLKPEKRNGLFGRTVAAAGNKERYQGSLNLNQFSGERQLSVIGISNNINKQGFSFAEILNFSEAMNGVGRGGMIENNSLPVQGLTNSPGITTTTAGGINYNDKWNSNMDVTGSYFYNKTGTELKQYAAQQWLLPGNNYFNNKSINARQANQNHRANLISDYKIDSVNSLRFSSSSADCFQLVKRIRCCVRKRKSS
jgi:5-hydroxyisourate hydrolase-like protein (transthyretin family)